MRIIILFILLLCTPVFSIAQSIDDYLDKAAQAQQAGEYNEALIYLKNAVQKNPDNIPVRLALARLYIQLGMGPQAEIELDKAAFLGASQADTQLLKIKSQLIQGKFKEVTSQINAVLNIKPDDIGRIRALQGQAYLNQGNIEKARNFFLRGARLAPDTLEVKTGLARLYTLDKKQAQAEALIKELYKQYPENPDVLLLMANLYREQKQYAKALEIFKAITALQPGNTAAWIGQVTSLIGLGQYKEADKTVKQLLSVDAEHLTGNHLQAIIAYQLKNYAQAQQAIKVIEKNNRNYKGILLVAGSVYYQLGKLDLAQQKLNEYLEVAPDDLGARKMLSAVYLKRKQGSQVIKLLKPFENSNDYSVFSLLSTAYNLVGNQKKSRFYLDKAVALAPDNSQLATQQRLNNALSGDSEALSLKDENHENFQGIGLPKILLLFKRKEFEQAIAIIQAYQQKDPDNLELYNLLAQAYLNTNQKALARQTLEKAIALDASFLPARIALARLNLLENKVKDAKREYQRILGKDPANETAMLDLARISLQENNEQEMLTWLNKARRANKASVKSRLLLNNYYQKKGQFEEAVKYSAELVDIQPENLAFLKNHAANLIQLKNYSQAIRSYKKMTEIRPDSPQTWYWLGSAQFLWKDYNNARQSFLKVLQLQPDHLIARSALIKLEQGRKNYQEALKQARELVKQHPESQIAYETLGDVLLLNKQAEQAIEIYKKGLALQDNNYLLVNKIARAYALSGQKDKAIATFENWLGSHPQNTRIRMTLAVLYQQNKFFDKARKHYEMLIEQEPDNISAINNLAMIYAELNDPRSLEYAEIAYSRAPENAAVLDTLGWLLVQNGEFKRALTLLKQAVQKNPADFDIRYHYAVALWKNGHNKEAKTQLNMIVPVPGQFKAREEAKQLLESL